VSSECDIEWELYFITFESSPKRVNFLCWPSLCTDKFI